jgi:hypothetical protein
VEQNTMFLFVFRFLCFLLDATTWYTQEYFIFVMNENALVCVLQTKLRFL